MKLNKILSIFILFFALSTTSFAQEQPTEVKETTTVQAQTSFDTLNFTEKQSNNKDFQEIVALIKKYENAGNKHNLRTIKNLYANNYINTDGFDKNTSLEIIKKNWKTFPNLKVISKIETIHINNNYATVQLFETLSGTSAKPSEITGDKGELVSNVRVILYLNKFGNNWKITNDKVLYEKSFIKYGKAKSINVEFSAPEIIKAGEEYTASAYIELPNNMLALGSISRENITYPESQPEQVFRQVPLDSGILERIMKANTEGKNEIAVASLGVTEMTRDYNKQSQVNLSGLIVAIQRVNVIKPPMEVKKEKQTGK